MGKLIDLTGQRFGRLVVLQYTGKDKRNQARWDCRCDCGNITNVSTQNLKCGNVQSCGCSRKGINSTHKQSRSRLYKIWCAVVQRTKNPNNPNYAYYGKRGITVCDSWSTFEPFRDWALENGYSENLTIDRIDNDKGYSPDNCRWIDRKQQAENRRSNHFLIYKGETKTLGQWATQFGMKRTTLCKRLNNGWSIEEALETPVKKNKK